MPVPGFEEIEPRVMATVSVCAIMGAIVGATPGAVAWFLPNIDAETIRLIVIAGVGTGALIGGIGSSTSLMVNALRGRRHRHSSSSSSSSGPRYRTEAVSSDGD